MTDIQAKANIVDVLRRINVNSWAEIKEPNGWSYHTNIGLLAKQAVDEIERLQAEITQERQAALEEAAQLADCWTDESDDDAVGACKELAARIRKLKTDVGLHASQQPHAADLLPSVANG